MNALTSALCLLMATPFMAQVLPSSSLKESEDFKQGRGIFYGLPETLLKVDVTLSHTKKTPGVYAEYTPFFFPRVAFRNDFIAFSSQSVKVLKADLATFGRTDPREVYFVTLKSGFLKNRVGSFTFQEDGRALKTSQTVENKLTDFILGSLGAAAGVGKLFVTRANQVAENDATLDLATATKLCGTNDATKMCLGLFYALKDMDLLRQFVEYHTWLQLAALQQPRPGEVNAAKAILNRIKTTSPSGPDWQGALFAYKAIREINRQRESWLNPLASFSTPNADLLADLDRQAKPYIELFTGKEEAESVTANYELLPTEHHYGTWRLLGIRESCIDLGVEAIEPKVPFPEQGVPAASPNPNTVLSRNGSPEAGMKTPVKPKRPSIGEGLMNRKAISFSCVAGDKSAPTGELNVVVEKVSERGIYGAIQKQPGQVGNGMRYRIPALASVRAELISGGKTKLLGFAELPFAQLGKTMQVAVDGLAGDKAAVALEFFEKTGMIQMLSSTSNGTDFSKLVTGFSNAANGVVEAKQKASAQEPDPITVQSALFEKLTKIYAFCEKNPVACDGITLPKPPI